MLKRGQGDGAAEMMGLVRSGSGQSLPDADVLGQLRLVNALQTENMPPEQVEVWTPALEQKLTSEFNAFHDHIHAETCLLYTSPSPRDRQKSRMPSSA